MPRTIFIGDVHGCIDELRCLLRKVQYDQGKDQLAFVGDLIHKGPDSLAVLELVKATGAIAVAGNHELGFLRFLKKNQQHQGFEIVLRQLGQNLKQWTDWIENLPLYHVTPQWTLVHAGIEPGRPIKKTSARILANIRTWDGQGKNLNRPESDPPWYECYKGDQPIIFGHWAQKGIVWRPNAIGLDSGCVYGNQLTALIWPERKLVQVQAAKVYKPVLQ